MLKVFYDGRCGLCNREINYYRTLTPRIPIEWLDLWSARAYFEALGYEFEAGLLKLHVLAEDGQMQRGVAAFLLIWQQLPYWRALATIIALPIIKPCAEKIYMLFAMWRFRKQNYGHCKIS